MTYNYFLTIERRKNQFQSLRYLISRLVVGLFRQVTTANKFLYYLRDAVFTTPWDTLVNDARYIITDVDAKIAETYTYFTRNNMNQKLNRLQHRIQTAFSLCFPNHRDNLSRYFRLNLQISDHYLSGSEILEDFQSWDDVNEDDHIRQMIYHIVEDLSGYDIKPHPVENILKVNLAP